MASLKVENASEVVEQDYEKHENELENDTEGEPDMNMKGMNMFGFSFGNWMKSMLSKEPEVPFVAEWRTVSGFSNDL